MPVTSKVRGLVVALALWSALGLAGCASQARNPDRIYTDEKVNQAVQSWMESGAQEAELPDGHAASGKASWYGPGLHGNTTASGEAFDMYTMTAAHKTLPFGTIVRVRRPDTGQFVDVRINDRGPFVEGRIIDLSYGAAYDLGMIKSGVISVALTIIPQ